jgi:threonyl-tRNA synthetase
MAEAVMSLFPEAKLAIGPPIEDGFYYDFDLPRPLTPEDLREIERRMLEIARQDKPLVRELITREQARELFKDQPYKLEILDEIPEGDTISIYRQGDWYDLCRGPHVESTGKVGYFKLLSVAGAYWRGDERRPMLQRIYGTAWPTEEELQQYLHRLEEAHRRDHRRLGRELDLFSIHEELGAGLIFWHPKGALVRSLLEDFWRREHLRRGYEFVYTPHIARDVLWQTSGHLDFYRQNMFPPMDVDGQNYLVKPMNCPFHITIYKTRIRSYRDLPLRWAELGTVYRYERSGVLHGLMRVRGFTQDDAHLFCRPDQIEDEILSILDLTTFILRSFGFEQYEVFLSTRPDKYVGSVENWERATAALQRALDRAGLPYEIDPGEGVFYGPKIDVKIRDVLGRSWQCSTIQVDFNLPERFDMEYIGDDGRPHRPIMIHRAIFGSIERFFGVLIEHYAGAFPFWLAPVQVTVIPIADRHLDYAQAVALQLKDAGIRVHLDDGKERMNAKIRNAQLHKVPYMFIVGDQEVASGSVSVRTRTGENQGSRPLAEVIAELIQQTQSFR